MLVILSNGAIFNGGVQAKNKDHTTIRLLKEVVPGADSFSEKEAKFPSTRPIRLLQTRASRP